MNISTTLIPRWLFEHNDLHLSVEQKLLYAQIWSKSWTSPGGIYSISLTRLTALCGIETNTFWHIRQLTDKGLISYTDESRPGEWLFHFQVVSDQSKEAA